ncbi:cilia- and flagella-associated protein HOATZ-like [Diretmus argenteus]
MSSRQAELPTEESQQHLIVFEGSSQEDVSYAKQLWSSVSLRPHLESRLVSADIRQKLPVVRPHRDTTAGPKTSSPEPPSGLPLPPPPPPPPRQRREERQRYLAMAEQREEILALLRKRREERIQKELLSLPYKPKMDSREQEEKLQKPSQLELDKEGVEQLQ